MILTLVSIDGDGVIRLATPGAMTADMLTTDAKGALNAIVGPDLNGRRVLLDMEKSDYIDSAFVGWLIHLRKELKSAGGAVVVHSVPPRVMQILTILRIPDVLPVAPDAAAARTKLDEVMASGGGR